MTLFAFAIPLGAFGFTAAMAPRYSAPYVAPRVVLVEAPERVPARHWERCVACDHAFGEGRHPRRWYGLCGPCYATVPRVDLPFYNSVTQRWRKCSKTGFGKADHEALVWDVEPSPIQVMLLRLVERFGLSTRPGTEGTLCEGLARRLGMDEGAVDNAIRGRSALTDWGRHRLVRCALGWLADDEAHCAALREEWGDDDEDGDPDDPEIIAVAAALRHELGRTA